MATPTKYTKTISTDFLNGKVDSSRLKIEIESSSISIALDRIDTQGDTCDIWFKDGLVAGDVTILNSIVSAHTGEALTYSSYVKIEEETVPTGGNFSIKTFAIDAIGNTTTSQSASWDYPISALSINFVSKAENEGDMLDMTVGENTIIGAIGGGAAPSTAWTAQNYVVGDRVNYTHPKYGLRQYTCILNTVSNENPTNTTYWKHGYELTVSSTVLKYAMKGYQINLFDGTNSNDIGRVIDCDPGNSKIYTNESPTNTFSPVTPTYVRMTVYVIDNLEIGTPWEYLIGESKIGGSYTPKDTFVTVHYTNNTAETKHFVIRVEYLY